METTFICGYLISCVELTLIKSQPFAFTVSFLSRLGYTKYHKFHFSMIR